MPNRQSKGTPNLASEFEKAILDVVHLPWCQDGWGKMYIRWGVVLEQKQGLETGREALKYQVSVFNSLILVNSVISSISKELVFHCKHFFFVFKSDLHAKKNQFWQYLHYFLHAIFLCTFSQGSKPKSKLSGWLNERNWFTFS